MQQRQAAVKCLLACCPRLLVHLKSLDVKQIRSCCTAGDGNIGALKRVLAAVGPSPQACSVIKSTRQYKQFLDSANCWGQTALMLACKNG